MRSSGLLKFLHSWNIGGELALTVVPTTVQKCLVFPLLSLAEQKGMNWPLIQCWQFYRWPSSHRCFQGNWCCSVHKHSQNLKYSPKFPSIGFKWMGYRLNAYVPPDMKQESTLTEKKTLFTNLRTTALSEWLNRVQDAFIIQRFVIMTMPTCCSLLAAS